MSDELLKRLETGHDKECAMSYGMHEHCCDCSYPARQEAAARVRELEAELERAHAAFEGTAKMLRLLDEARGARNAVHALSGQADRHRDELLADLDAMMAKRDGLLADNVALKAEARHWEQERRLLRARLQQCEALLRSIRSMVAADYRHHIDAYFAEESYN